MKISLIAAIDQNRLLADSSGFLWHLPKDIAHFRQYTLAHPHLLVGKSTYLQMLGWFKEKHNIWVLTSDPEFQIPPNLGVKAASVEQAIAQAKSLGIPELVCIGGAKTYESTLPWATHLILTHVQHTFTPRGKGVYFPSLNPKDWQLASTRKVNADSENPHAMVFSEYTKKPQ